jgi:hypothetical protein
MFKIFYGNNFEGRRETEYLVTKHQGVYTALVRISLAVCKFNVHPVQI